MNFIYFFQLFGNALSIFTFIIAAKYLEVNVFGDFTAQYSIFIICATLVDYGLSAIGSRICRDYGGDRSLKISLYFLQIIVCFLILLGYFIYVCTVNNHRINLSSVLSGIIVGLVPAWIYLSIGSLKTASFLMVLPKLVLFILVLVQIKLNLHIQDVYYLYFLIVLFCLFFNIFFIFYKKILIIDYPKNILKLYKITVHYYFQHSIGFISNNIGQYLILSYLGATSSALYSISDRIARPLLFLISPFRSLIISCGYSKTIRYYEKIIIFGAIIFVFTSIIFINYFWSFTFLHKFNKSELIQFITLFIINNTILCLIEVNITIKYYLKGKESFLTNFSACMNIFSILLILILMFYFGNIGSILALIFTNIALFIYIKLFEIRI
ncbi:oligosaccharide flippase family protein [Polynucleobacter sp. AP-Reno-20A-A9]|uniref:oligosaccharide flippase family protein n=1 Tax=Polynucleobacter sp. AP-Reno-20A-A9 TaxID=2576925 RepID=UPI001C0C6D07|nr:oligosaccharide flippase family protein [Polynucleobacter sp. AP-Reno-20A-A9]